MKINRKVGALSLMLLAGGCFLLYKLTPSPQDNPSSHQEKSDNESHEEKMLITLDEQKMSKIDIKTLKLTASHHQKRITFPGQVSLNENTVIHVVASVPGVVTKVYKNLGEDVKAGETLAVIESREMAEAKSAYLSVYKDLILKKDLLEREEKLWKMKVKAETEFLKTRNIYETTKIDLEQKKQKLLALSMKEAEIENLPSQDTPLNLYTIEAPINGKILERHTSLGEIINSDRQLFVVANLDKVWVNISISAQDLPTIQKGQKVDLYASNNKVPTSATLMYVSPVINEESRTGRAIVEVDNTQGTWHPGDFVSAQVILDEKSPFLSVPSEAIQKIQGNSYVFLKSGNTQFEAKKIVISGTENEQFIQIKEGLKEGDEIAITNTFLLKAELGKSEAEHSH
ncbi:efflux RND transporter periplasmic adaptor subunit [Candidatus Odyssella thessalonicensis]|uniref:efflux RND transporter periplasmic adaptor subunit n=1 Tax=Candidatus Odyssella thessalonicensis TaxID=84647 RepID=UPI000225AA10|nr:efflux RND transporter periplasmic adaptor subunit [Candidatus Odyssella thessalonicensis]